jgi:heme-degrading monooxygenase HmoA
MFAVMFEYRVDQDGLGAFEAAYGPGGEWSVLFAGARGYFGTDLLRDESTPGHYMVIDRWESATDYDEFVRSAGTAYTTFNEACKSLYREEAALGRFVGV